MPEDNRKDISDAGRSYMTISLLPCKVKVLIAGGGRAGFVKAKTFLKNGCNVYVLSREFADEFKELENTGNMVLIKESYDKTHIADKHIVVIATDDEALNDTIKNDCEALAKVYLTCSDFKNGMFVMPVQRETREINFSVNTKSGSPNTSLFLADLMEDYLKEYDEFVRYVHSLRDGLKGSDRKHEIMKLVNTRGFYEKFKEGTHEGLLDNI